MRRLRRDRRPTGQLDVKPTFKKKQVEGEITRATVSLTKLQRAYQCPYCRHNPLYPAWADKGMKEDQVRTPGEVSGTVAVTLAGLLLTPAVPVVGVPLLVIGGAAVSSLVRLFRGGGGS